ncbi:chorion protein S15 [Scaptodrosophila lebanonensis]|uniref:Chorion protein S15 n=1 Tax=Drosophila lebanonensis TaxID=7225 RepID=A0A6J2TA55_DROLE|nr:chorion protein S15 [Scaptodrosophila lebanonensis]
MKYLFVCVSFALFAYINASSLYGGNHGGYGLGRGGDSGPVVAYQAIPVHSYGRQSYGQPLRSYASEPRAAAAAAAASSAVLSGNYRQVAIPAYELDAGYHGGHGGYGGHRGIGIGSRGGY